MDGDEDAIRFNPADPKVREIVEYLIERAARGSGGLESAAMRADLARIVAEWTQRSAEERAKGARLRYWEKPAPFGRTAPHLMRDAERIKSSEQRAWPTPNSLREIEPSSAFILRHIGPRRTPGETDERA
jgi:hypothetical protein